MQSAEPSAVIPSDRHHLRAALLPALLAIAIFAGLSTFCSIRSDGFITDDACSHYLAAHFAFSSPLHFVDVWDRPLAILLYATPAHFGGRYAVRAVCMLIAIACALVSHRIAAAQGVKSPVLALLFTLGQPMLFLHSFGEMTELPFALVLGLAFLAYQSRRFYLAAALAAWLPLGRPEGFGILALLVGALLLHRKWFALLLLPLPLLLWDWAGWTLSHASGPWYRWLYDCWPYASKSSYGHGQLLALVAVLPTIISPLVMPAMILGIALSLRRANLTPAVLAQWVCTSTHRASTAGVKTQLHTGRLRTLRSANRNDAGAGAFEPYAAHMARCRALTALIPLFVLAAHSLLYWLGDMGSLGEARYLLVVAPFWGALSARGWEWAFGRLRWNHAVRWAGAAVLLPPIVANAFHPVAPVHLREDWQIAHKVADWYQQRPAYQARYPKVMAAHPGIVYFLDIDRYDYTRIRSFDTETLHAHKPGTLLIWSPIHGDKNSSADRAFPLADVYKNGWFRIPDAEIPQARAVSVNQPDPKTGDIGGQWYVFVSPRPAIGVVQQHAGKGR